MSGLAARNVLLKFMNLGTLIRAVWIIPSGSMNSNIFKEGTILLNSAVLSPVGVVFIFLGDRTAIQAWRLLGGMMVGSCDGNPLEIV